LLKSKVAWATGLILVATLATTVATYRSVHLLTENSRWVSHTLEVIKTIHDAQFHLMAAESSQRGFLLTEDAAYLIAFESNLHEVDQLVDETRALTRDNPLQTKRIQHFEQKVKYRVELLRTVLRLTNLKALSPGQRRMFLDDGATAMNDL
jgi:CHASE3 domain sensor protein